MLHLIHSPLAPPDLELPEIAVGVDRLTLAKRRWRGAAEDGTEFGFELEVPLRDGETVFQSLEARYVIRQQAEPVLEIPLDVTLSAAAGIGWAIGNLHLELSAEPMRLFAPDDPAARQLLDRLRVPYRPGAAVFRPGRFARGDRSSNELGPSHRH